MAAKRPGLRPASVALWAVILGLSATGCSNQVSQSRNSAGTASVADDESPGAAISETGGQLPGTIEGKILFQGKQRDWPPDGRNMSDVVVFLRGNTSSSERSLRSLPQKTATSERADPADSDGDKNTAVLDQIDMTFVPHVVLMQQGGVLELRNSDSALHNVNGFASRNQAFNVTITPGSSTTVTLPKHEFIRVTCNFHTRMNAWIAVLPNPHYTRVDEQGQFTLSGIPPGTYELAGWYENVYPPHVPHRVSTNVTVRPRQVTVVELDFP